MDEFTEKIITLGQRCIEKVPAVVLGAGASLQYGVGGMDKLKKYLVKTIRPVGTKETRSWRKFADELNKGKDLEAAINSVQLPASLESAIINYTRLMVLKDDQKVFAKLARCEIVLAATILIQHLLRTTHPFISIITTNYDRLAEYATDSAGVSHSTGFSHGYYRQFRGVIRAESRTQREQTVEVLKVHGSVDWFIDEHGKSIALPDAIPPPDGLTPLLVTPGIGKYQLTHEEPFRTIISRSDEAFAKAASVLSVGYGFNDRHIQPKLAKRVLTDSVPVVVLAKTLTPNARSFISSCTHNLYLALEKSGTGSKAYFCDQPKGVEIPSALWNLKEFIQAVTGQG